MTAPFLGQGMPANESWFADQLKSLQRQITELRAAQTLNAASVGTGGLSSSNFDGTLTPPAVGTQGWGLAGGPNGAAIVGTLYVRDGIIGDDALTNPVAPASLDGTNTGLTLTTSDSSLRSGTIAVPDGFSTALVLANGAVGGVNSTGSLDGISAHIVIAGVSGDTVTESVPSGLDGHAYPAFASTVTGLPSDGTGTLSIATWGHTAGASWTGGTARLSAIVTFLR